MTNPNLKIGSGPINVNLPELPKECVSGKVPAWLVWGATFALGGAAAYLWYRASIKKSEAMVEVAREKRKTAEVEKTTKIELARQERETKIIVEAMKRCTSTPTYRCRESSSQNPSDKGIDVSCDDDAGEFPEWEDAYVIKDKVVDSELTAHNECINVVVARQNLGKTTIAKQLIVEAIEGVSSNIFPSLNGKTGPQWEAFYYASEADPKFKENFGTKLKELGSRFHILLDNFHFKNIEHAVAHIRQTALNANGNCVIVLDNITDMFPGIKKSQADDFIGNLKEIRKCINNQGRRITFIIVVHANRSNGEIAGTVVWENRGEAIFYIEQDKKHNDNNHRIIRIGKNRRGPSYIEIPVKRVMTPYMHFEHYDNDHVEAKEPVNNQPLQQLNEVDNRQPVTTEVEDFFASIYKKDTYGHGSIFNDYKDRYQLKSKDTVRNAINRSQKRKSAA